MAELEVLTKVGETVLPGDVVGRVGPNVKIGPGLMQEKSSIVATKLGQLRFRQPDKYWVETSQRRVRFSPSSAPPAHPDLPIGSMSLL